MAGKGTLFRAVQIFNILFLPGMDFESFQNAIKSAQKESKFASYLETGYFFLGRFVGLALQLGNNLST